MLTAADISIIQYRGVFDITSTLLFLYLLLMMFLFIFLMLLTIMWSHLTHWLFDRELTTTRTKWTTNEQRYLNRTLQSVNPWEEHRVHPNMADNEGIAKFLWYLNSHTSCVVMICSVKTSGFIHHRPRWQLSLMLNLIWRFYDRVHLKTKLTWLVYKSSPASGAQSRVLTCD